MVALWWPDSPEFYATTTALEPTVSSAADPTRLQPKVAVATDAAPAELAWLRLESTPTGAEVFRGDDRLGRTPFDWRPTVDSEPVALKFELPGYAARRRVIALTVGGDAAIVVRTQLEARPPDAEPPKKTSPAPKPAARRGPKRPEKKQRYQKL